MLAFNGRGMLTASGAVTTVGDEDVNIKWGGEMWKVLLALLALCSITKLFDLKSD